MENIIQNEELVKKLAAVETVEELNKVLADNDIVLEDGITAEQFLEAMKGGADEELSEDDLMDVSGGVSKIFLRSAARAAGMAVAKYIAYMKKRGLPWLAV